MSVGFSLYILRIKLSFLILALAAIIVGANAQTCTVNNGSGSWTTRTCSEGGSLTSSFSGTVVIPSGAVVTS